MVCFFLMSLKSVLRVSLIKFIKVSGFLFPNERKKLNGDCNIICVKTNHENNIMPYGAISFQELIAHFL